MNNCVRCGKTIWPFQIENRNAHKKCDEIFFAGYDAFKHFAAMENFIHGVPSANQLYYDRTVANWKLCGSSA